MSRNESEQSKVEEWTVLKVESRSKVDGPAESGFSWVKVNGLLMESGPSRQKWAVWPKVDGQTSKRGWSTKPYGQFSDEITQH